jgi:two-component system nitrate/nitrite sensor histidine kinase NarX
MARTWRPTTLATKLSAIGTALLLLALGSIGLTLWVTWHLEGGAAAVNEAGRLRMQVWRLAQGIGTAEPAAQRARARQFDQSLSLLRRGDPARPLFLPGDDATHAALDEVGRHWNTLRAQWLEGPDIAANAAAVQATALVQRIDTLVDAIESQLSRWTTVLTAVQLSLVAVAIAAAVATLYTSYLFVFNPLSRLRAGLARVEQGDLSARVEVHSADEFGRLGEAFNRMAQTLQGFTRDLEDKVREKTETLRAERERLAFLYEVSDFVGQAPTLDALAQGFVRRARAAANADAVLVRWFDPAQQQYLMLAASGVPEDLLTKERCLRAGDCICAGRADGGGARVVRLRDVSAAADRAACERLGFEAVVTVPVRLQDAALGEIDLLYRDAGATPSEADRTLLESLAKHLANGMESMRAAALEREAAVAEERSLLAREMHDSIAQSLAFLKIQVQLLRNALNQGDSAAAQRALDELGAGLRESLADVRELLVHFRTRTNSDDIVPALKTTLQKFRNQTGLQTHLDIQGAGVPLPPDVQVQLLHVVQEALSNVRKHADAREVWLNVQQHPGWRIEVRDDGRGFDPAVAASDETHVGLRIMRERAASIGASVHVGPAAGGGTRVVVTMPERQPEAA